MDKPVISKLTKSGLGALSLALILSFQPATGALAQGHDHGGGRGGGREAGHIGGGRESGHMGGGGREGGHMGGGYVGGGHYGGGRTAYGHGGYGHGYYGGHGGTRYLWGGLPFYFSGGYYYGDCGWLRERAEDTGSPYWYHRYHLCRAY